MNTFMWFLLTLAAALVGGIVLTKLKVPAGAIVGALLVVGALNIITGKMFMFKEVKVLTKVVAGLFIGMNVTMETVRNLKKMIRPTLLLIFTIIPLCFIMGMILYYTAGMDVVTSLFCVSPGGMMDATLMTMDMGGDSAVVAVLQVLRLLSVYCISMPLVKVIAKKSRGGEGEEPAERAAKLTLPREQRAKRIAFSAAVAAVGGTIGYFLSELVDFSVVIMICTMVVSAAVNLKTGKLYMPKNVRKGVQMLSGALIGVGVTYDSLVNLRRAIVPAIVIIIGFVLINILLATLINRVFKVNMTTAMLSTSAGGATESSLVALDFGADPAVVSVLQISRMVCTTAFYPILVKLISPLL